MSMTRSGWQRAYAGRSRTRWIVYIIAATILLAIALVLAKVVHDPWYVDRPPGYIRVEKASLVAGGLICVATAIVLLLPPWPFRWLALAAATLLGTVIWLPLADALSTPYYMGRWDDIDNAAWFFPIGALVFVVIFARSWWRHRRRGSAGDAAPRSDAIGSS